MTQTCQYSSMMILSALHFLKIKLFAALTQMYINLLRGKPKQGTYLKDLLLLEV